MPLVGPLTVTIVSGENLHSVVLFGNMSPYVQLKAGSEEFKSKPAKDGHKNPKWNQAFIFNLDGKTDSLHLHVFNQELVSDTCIGRCDIIMNEHTLPKYLGNHPFEIVDKNNFKKVHGKVLLQFAFSGTGLPKQEEVKTIVEKQAPATQTQASVTVQTPPATVTVQTQPATTVQAVQQPQVVFVQPVVQQQRPQVVYQQQPTAVYQQPTVMYQQPQVMYQQPQVMYQQPQVMYQQPQVMYQQPQQQQVVYQQQQQQQPQQQPPPQYRQQ